MKLLTFGVWRCSCGTTLSASEVLYTCFFCFRFRFLLLRYFQQGGQLAATWNAWSVSSSGRAAALVDSSGSGLWAAERLLKQLGQLVIYLRSALLARYGYRWIIEFSFYRYRYMPWVSTLPLYHRVEANTWKALPTHMTQQVWLERLKLRWSKELCNTKSVFTSSPYPYEFYRLQLLAFRGSSFEQRFNSLLALTAGDEAFFQIWFHLFYFPNQTRMQRLHAK